MRKSPQRYRMMPLIVFILFLMVACNTQPTTTLVEVTVIKEKEVEKEVTREVTVVSEVEVEIEVTRVVEHEVTVTEIVETTEIITVNAPPPPATGIVKSIVNAPIVPNGTVSGAFPDFVINFDVSLDPAVAGREMQAGDEIHITLPDAFAVEGEPVADDGFADWPLGHHSWTALIQGWPQVPIFSSFPPGQNLDKPRYTNHMEGAYTLVVTAETEVLGSMPPFPGPGFKQIHIFFSHLRNPEPGFYEIGVVIRHAADGSEERGSAYVEIISEAVPTISITSVFNGDGRPNSLYQTAAPNETVAIPYHFLLWNSEGTPLQGAEINMIDDRNAEIHIGEKVIGQVKITAPSGAEGQTLSTETPSEEIKAPISLVPAGHLVVQFTAGSQAGLYGLTFSMNGGNAVQTFVTVQ